jgi:DNA polymerase-4
VSIRVSKLVHGNYQISLFDDTEEEIHLFEAMDYIKHKYGAGSLMRATTLTTCNRVRFDNKAFSG